MNKNEFLNQLQVSLNGKLKASQVEDNIQYYNDYVEEQMRRGRTEKEIMETLGSPRLIARTILDASKESERIIAETESFGSDQTVPENDGAFRTRTNVPWLAKFLMAPKWVRTACGIVTLVGVCAVVIFLLKFLFPFLVILLIALFLRKLFWDWLR
ncbi:MAG: DUF1700 domain-containing protein [Acetatifactor sp.]|nr:DUF1700 domain-containing protein [Acetatifactor sp.]